MRKRATYFKLLVMAMMAILVLAGCGKSSSDGAKTKTTGTRVIKTAAGKVKIPTHPKRIVTNVYTGDVASLGAHVVGATSIDFASPYLSKSQKKGMTNLGLTMKPEAVLKLKPDLIVTSNESDVKTLKKIAPVVYIPYGTTGNIKQTATKFGQILNRQKQAQKWITKFETEAKAQKQRLIKSGITPAKTTIGIYDMQNGKLFVDGAKWGRGGQALVTGLGFKLPAAIQKIDKGPGFQQVSLEALKKYSADWLFFTNTTNSQSNNKQAISDLKANPVWKSLPAVKSGQVVQLPENKMYYFDPNAVYQQLKLVTDAMLKKAK
ncbi:ABC transporter substrate-binding protein [Lentilactobacillus farraginis]|uniref:Iron (Fe) ABC superfamily ATP binding cassette transporter, binding protein n=2 Tax=Lentilactobacillus farraginis DSM 18382 = JCM 14108 TaxID=1423743 RepID=A0A0R1W068_9LACO|nr:ABC transporter substrate-binding protein [Lentilactobacillus farraginis]KRM09252.1 iron (Fe) ABC superfamily ATP binding cassette transporter, binding protein [Lentilactobacillus farraginis DSM 18382 = JCM 14108]